jgi:competence protein ComFB
MEELPMTNAERTVPTKTLTEEYVLVNAYDDLVRTNVKNLMKEMDMCQCEKCYLDACALVFNRQYTRFVTTKQGALFAKVPEMGTSNQVDMTVTIMDALQMVQAMPNH